MKNVSKLGLCLAIIALIWSCQPKAGDTREPHQDYLNYEAIAEKLLERSQLQPGERVLLVGQQGKFDSLIPLLRSGIEKAGAAYLGAVNVDSIQPPSWSTDFTMSLANMDDAELPVSLSSVDLGIMLPGATPSDKVYRGLQQVLESGKGRTIHFHWAGAYNLSGQLQEPDSIIDIFYQNVLLKTNYAELAAKQAVFENAMRDNWVQVTTPAGTDIKFKIESRQVTKQDGDASLAHMDKATTLIDREVELPAGAIRVAPIEETVEGAIAFPDSEWQGKMVKGLVMKFEYGKVIEIKATENIEAVQQELQQAGEAGKSFREFALGFNPLLKIPDEEPWIPYYGYGAGVVRLSLGDNSELGGNVTGGYVRWNFFIDATVKVGEEVWVEGGVMIK